MEIINQYSILLGMELTSEQKWGLIRKERNDRLKSSDWIIVAVKEKGEIIPQEWATYRQKLRDIPQLFDNPDDVVFPTEPGV